MDKNELKDRQDTRWLVGTIACLLIIGGIIVFVALLNSGQSDLALEIVRIGGPLVGGFLGGYGVGRGTK